MEESNQTWSKKTVLSSPKFWWIPIFNETADTEFDNSNMLTEQLQDSIKSQEPSHKIWLTTLPIKNEGFQIDKQSFWDLIKIRYGY